MHHPRLQTPRVPPVAKVVEALEKRYGGKISYNRPVNIAATMENHRGISEVVAAFTSGLMGTMTMSTRLKELVILRMGWDCECLYEFSQHRMRAEIEGFSDQEIIDITRPIASGEWTALEVTLLQMVDDVYVDDMISDPTWAEMQGAGLSLEECMEYLMLALMYRFVCGFLNTCGVQPEAGAPGWPEPVAG
jgi:4-carboxymuconolactone decarboxylase